MEIVIVGMMVIVLLMFLVWLGLGFLGFRAAICRGHELDMSSREKLDGTPWGQYYDAIMDGIGWIDSRPSEDVEIFSEDGLKLHAKLILNDESRGTALLFHGYRTHPEVDFSASAHVYYEAGNHLLLIDQRASGQSEGNYIGFGVLESHDCVKWAEYVAGRFGEDMPITLAGLSMGASTVLMAAAHRLPVCVKGIIADSAFSSPGDIIQNEIQSTYHVKGSLLIKAIGFWSRILAHYGLHELSTEDAMQTNAIPVFFVHGTADRRVPHKMTMRASEICKAPCELFLVEGVDHGTGFLAANKEYVERLSSFLNGITYAD